MVVIHGGAIGSTFLVWSVYIPENSKEIWLTSQYQTRRQAQLRTYISRSVGSSKQIWKTLDRERDRAQRYVQDTQWFHANRGTTEGKLKERERNKKRHTSFSSARKRFTRFDVKKPARWIDFIRIYDMMSEGSNEKNENLLYGLPSEVYRRKTAVDGRGGGA